LEAIMANEQPTGYKERGYLGRALVTLGFAGLLADIAYLAPPFDQLLQGLTHGLVSIAPTLGLSLLHAARVIALQQVDYASVASRILVLFSALALMIIGVVLLGRPSMANSQEQQGYAASFKGDR
jgi:predicted cobalt transporter CbtA